MRICSFCLIFLTATEFLLVSGRKLGQYFSPKLKDFGPLTPIDNSYKELYAVLGTPIRLPEEKMPEIKRFKRTGLGVRLPVNHRGNPITKSPPPMHTTTKKNWFWNLFS